MSNVTSPLRQLLKTGVEYLWSEVQESAFKLVKELICKHTKLCYYDPSKPTSVQTDASGIGIGAALLQENGPIAFASKALTQTEQNYVNIEREMLAVVYACKHFHHYLFGAPQFKILSDHA